jgi:hypothetical protein
MNKIMTAIFPMCFQISDICSRQENFTTQWAMQATDTQGISAAICQTSGEFDVFLIVHKLHNIMGHASNRYTGCFSSNLPNIGRI